MTKIRVLAVDDSPFIHKAIARALNSDDYEICANAKNGKEGHEYFSAYKPDVVVMDITMPVMDGLEATEIILSKDPQAKIIMLSAMGDEELIKSAQDKGVSAFLQKPFKGNVLMETISSVL